MRFFFSMPRVVLLMKTKNVWAGRATSNIVKVQFASEFLAPMDDYSK